MSSEWLNLIGSNTFIAREKGMNNAEIFYDGRRYSTGPGEAYQMDWGFVNVETVLELHVLQ